MADPRLVVPSPEVKPRKFGLYSVADVQTAEAHALMGIEYENLDNCNWSNFTGLHAWCEESPSPKDSTLAWNMPNGNTFDMFYLYSIMRCAGLNEFNTAKNRAVKRFNFGEERGVERRLNTLLSDDANSDDITQGTLTDLALAVARLEEYIDCNFAGAGTILVSRAAGSLLSKNGTLKRHGNRMETELGTTVASSCEFGTDGPGSATATEWTTTYLWAVGNVEVRYGQMIAFDPVLVNTTTGVNEVQTAVITGTPTGGSFTLTFNGETTAAIAYNANAAAVQSALLALSNLDTGDVVVTGTNPNFTITFGGNYASANPPQITATPSLTGGTSPSVTTATTTSGHTGETDNTYQSLVEKGFVLGYDCAPAVIEANIA